MASQFEELARAEIGRNKYIVVSRRDDGRVSVAQQLVTETDSAPIYLYMKNAIQVDASGLHALRNALSQALEALTSSQVPVAAHASPSSPSEREATN